MDTDEETSDGSRTPAYDGEDTRLTSSKELTGWYSYGWAAEVFAICGVGSFIPITLEQLARERGVLVSDHRSPCVPVTSTAASSAALLFRSAGSHADKGQCIVHLFGRDVNTASFAMYTFSLSVLLQALVIISMSGAADHGHYRKKLLLSFAVAGSCATMLFLPMVPKFYVVAAMLAIISNTCFGASFVLLNSFLPLLVRYHPSNQQGSKPASLPEDFDPDNYDREEHTLADSSAALLPAADPSSTTLIPKQTSSNALQLSTRISAYGIGIGYSAAVLVQILAIFILLLTSSTTFSLRLVIFFIGLWWLLFTIPAALYLRPRPGPPLPIPNSQSYLAYAAYASYAWRSLGTTILRARRLKDISLFLLAWFLLSDALATVGSTAILFAKTDLQMPAPALAFISVITTLTGVLGAILWPRLSTYLHLRPIHTICACIALFETIPLYGLLGYIPAVQRLGFLGLQQDWEMYTLGAIFGLVLGGLGSYCRALFGELVPPGSEAAFYALYAITDKGSSVFGPAVVGAITDRYGEIRPAFVFLTVLIGMPLPVLLCVDVERGRREGAKMSRELARKAALRTTDGGLGVEGREREERAGGR